MKRWLVLILILGMQLSCGESKELPPDILTPEKMGPIMADISLAEAWVENYFPSKENGRRDSAIAREVDKVLAIHKVGQDQFRKSYMYYKSNPVQFRELLDSVFHQNQMYQQRIFSSVKGAAPVRDSQPPRTKPIPVQ